MKIIPDQNVKREKIAASIREKYATAINAVNSKYSKEEIDTWSVQLKEAELFLQDSSADTPFLNTLIKNRDISLNELSSRIVNNNNIYLEKVSAILNQQQKELDELYENRRH